MCAWLEVSKSGFYDWRDRPASATAERRVALTALIKKIFDDSDETYGYRRVHAQLGRQGVEAGAELVRALMRAAGLVACQPRPCGHSLTGLGEAVPTGPRLASHQARCTHQGADQLSAGLDALPAQLGVNPPVAVGLVGVVEDLLDQRGQRHPSLGGRRGCLL